MSVLMLILVLVPTLTYVYCNAVEMKRGISVYMFTGNEVFRYINFELI